MSEPHGCPEVRALLPEVATGALAGDGRASALAHVEGCAACRRELAVLSRAADALLLLAPPVEPPPGFEGGVLARLDADGGPAPGRGRRRSLLPGALRVRPAIAFAVALAVAAAGGAQAVRWQTADDRTLARQYRRTLDVADGRYLKAIRMATMDGQPAGTAFLYQGNPSWLLVTVNAAPADGAYDLVVIDRDGTAHPAGVCQVAARAGTAGHRIDVAVAAVAQIQLRSRTVPGAVVTGTG